jgi:hypothetical protein
MKREWCRRVAGIRRVGAPPAAAALGTPGARRIDMSEEADSMARRCREAFRDVRMQLMAQWAAEDAHERLFSSHFNCYRFECSLLDPEDDSVVLCLYDNHPYKGGPHWRQEQLTRFRQRIDQLGYTELAHATFPPDGDAQEGYSFAMLIDNYSPEMEDQVRSLYHSEVARTMREIFEKTGH